jgi:prophage regulatory protein
MISNNDAKMKHHNQLHKALLRKREVLKRTGYSNSSLYLRIAEGKLKPGVKIGPRAVAWPEDEIDSHINSLIAVRDAQFAAGGAA